MLHSTKTMDAYKRVLLVDDDPLVRKIYQEGLSRDGFVVDTAEDGLAATHAIQTHPPDALVLDLMMPKFGGLDVLRFLRSRPAFRRLPVIVLSNSFMDELSQEAAGTGVQKALLKIRCTPAVLSATLNEIFRGAPVAADPSVSLPLRAPGPALSSGRSGIGKSTAQPGPITREKEFLERAREDFVANSASVVRDLKALQQSLQSSRNDAEQELRLQNLYRKVHFLSATAGMAGRQRIARMSSALEALLYSLIGKRSALNPSFSQTIAQAVELVVKLLHRAGEPDPAEPPAHPRVLVVDDNVVNTRLLVASLRQVGLGATSTENPLTALELLRRTRFDLVLLDIEMPGMDGFEVCRQLRALEGYAEIPVIFVTSHSDFASRSKSVLSGGNDLIAKPVVPMEVAVKAVGHLIRMTLPAQSRFSPVPNPGGSRG